MKDFLRISLPVLLLCLVTAEVALRTIVPAAEPPKGCFDEVEALYMLCPNQGKGTMTFGKSASLRARWRVNNHGWNSEIDYRAGKDKPRIAIIGDSYVEALQVDVDKNVAAVLRESLEGRFDVYSFGRSGYPLSQYLHVSRYVAAHFSPDVLVFVVVHNDFEESILEFNPSVVHLLTLAVTDTTVEEIEPRPNYSLRQYSWKRDALRHSALVRYMLLNLRLTRAFQKGLPWRAQAVYNANIDVEATRERRAAIEAATKYTISRIRSENPGRRVVFVMDAPRYDIYSGDVEKSSVLFLHSMMSRLCANEDVELLDLTDAMKSDYDLKHTRFEFDANAHWNEYGHRFVSDQLKQHLEHR